jgi:hypothetical protein
VKIMRAIRSSLPSGGGILSAMRFFKPSGLIAAALVLPILFLAGPGFADVRNFGYAAIMCGLDDPHDTQPKTDYLDEVAAFTNIAQVCVDADASITADRIARAHAADVVPLLYVEPVFFERAEGGATPRDKNGAASLWQIVRQAILLSGAPADQIIFYLVDEPSLFGLSEADVTRAAMQIRADFPQARLLMIEAYSEAGPPPIPKLIDYWGFDVYGVPDPAAEPRYAAYLDQARAGMRPGQKLVLVMEAVYYPKVHGKGRAAQAKLGDVADASYRYAVSRGDVSMILAYTWAGGIDSLDERGVRDLPPVVRARHEVIGRAITGKQ